MTAEDEEFNRIEMESRIKQEYVRSIKREENNRMIGAHQDHVRRLMEELAIARKCLRELGDRLATLEKPWAGLTEKEVEDYWDWEDFQCGAGRSTILEMVRDIEAKLKERNL